MPPANAAPRGRAAVPMSSIPRAIPNAPGAPRVLGTETASAGPVSAAPPIGAPGGREAGAPLDLSTLSGEAGAACGDAARVRRPCRRNCRRHRRPIRAPPVRGWRRCRRRPSRRTNTTSPTATCCTRITALATQAFRDFVRKYPDEQLMPDAQYWLGEALYPAAALSRRGGSLPRGVDQIRALRQGAGFAAAPRPVARGDEEEGSGLRHARRSRPQISARLRQREALGRRRNRSVSTADEQDSESARVDWMQRRAARLGCAAGLGSGRRSWPLTTARRSRRTKQLRFLTISSRSRRWCWRFPAGRTRPR